ncbi:unnamed protein product [Gordionus sp. m RMFG-2023]|uniref:NADH dehydrogenase [ubiquinone] 1 alpha subcomplex subunit 8-like n=1 Tax=Gordionus sp. m RMFG-2023 TaxID=3053472 RepID=UPI0030E1A82A
MSGIQGVVTDSSQLPSDEELYCPELKLTSVPLYAGARHFAKYCYAQNNEFWLCRKEERDPRKCLKEGKILSLCALEYFDKVKESCPNQFKKLYKCIDWKSSRKDFTGCKKEELSFDYCMYNKLGLLRFEPGYMCRPHIHKPTREKPEIYKGRTYPDDYLKEYPQEFNKTK